MYDGGGAARDGLLQRLGPPGEGAAEGAEDVAEGLDHLALAALVGDDRGGGGDGGGRGRRARGSVCCRGVVGGFGGG